MASILELRSRIKSVNSTKKITKAQELIATSRITKAQARVAASKPYAEEITKVLSALASASSSLDHPLLNERPEPKRAAVLVVTSDRGMCGGYNSNVLKETEELFQLLRSEGKDPVIYVLGAKGLGYYTFRERDVKGAWTGFSQEPGYADAAKASRHLVELFMAGSGTEVEAPNGEGTVEGVDELHIVYTRFVSMLTQKPEVRRMAPLEISYTDEEFEMGADALSDSPTADVQAQYEFEPEAGTLLSALLPKYISTRIYASLLDAAASESAARRTAMKAATDNANELVETLSRQANQARQAQITQEISEIVGGANALADSAGSD
ncbi:F0F1 ATP synthase subunit gamma [Rhodococcus sp. IEGM 1401]|jgi:F-type H+-transporting ATPase subunit gamma|uniref:F0F1 ATP synthase subunit gamma n=1 Tax=unclassified Rhodococcus (in: high G+C Gram-positive bacteria) TaxID=192944 RepID=UPI000B9A3C48|nr:MULTISPECIES: F0F1 ATP synthase subunit gamma [unclassified Rhodococcus (in: high G+C Gram-positive bacteria)]MCZ4562401.1 F0F1 ATP synthase subunit gamma [Rhodococcus sp. IEGM 1401]MDI6626684.1 F0F1 ATP synthase subunit gamma [Rhodococcus sp. (in: high G+C Gram-positive bacteria)]MDI9922443.1 F0F1 ATP synthase subunit gamma [Rhodococcus sp. IEGM 1372]MDV7991749.1 F0F1 ATP synthase subunit gamma [Rhodococcus sp. IEGM 1374]MDV8034993.1 F0F1 ATP synthase subunit gamma [Rhodococcus sp. IEGM 14